MDNDTSKPRAIERRVFREDIREQLIDDILSGRLPPGARIVETRVAQQFGVSQGPVREALRDLELFGFVVSSPFRGTQVRQISKADLLEIYPIRAALESVAARAQPRNDDASSRLEDIATMREAASSNNAKAQADADHAFHATIIKAAGNRARARVADDAVVSRRA
jgi:DNA-binding GntR family transcriptional regulator